MKKKSSIFLPLLNSSEKFTAERKAANVKGFTLIELLVVIAIIALLASIILTSLGRSQEKARDARRVSDMKEIQLALSLYYNDNNCYPTDIYASTNSCNGVSGAPGLAPNYISVVPKNLDGTDYSYAPLTSTSGGTDCDSYHLAATLENDIDVPSDKVGMDGTSGSTADSRGFYACSSVDDSIPGKTNSAIFDVMP